MLRCNIFYRDWAAHLRDGTSRNLNSKRQSYPDMLGNFLVPEMRHLCARNICLEQKGCHIPRSWHLRGCDAGHFSRTTHFSIRTHFWSQRSPDLTAPHKLKAHVFRHKSARASELKTRMREEILIFPKKSYRRHCLP